MLLGGVMTVNVMHANVMLTVFFSLAAAIVVFEGILLLTMAHP
jgi:hypothetical protein